MARKGRVDRGLVPRTNAEGKIMWYVRIGVGGGEEQWFGPFNTKTEARGHYQRCKTEQLENRFDPERYRKRGILMSQVIESYLPEGMKKKAVRDERYFIQWWMSKLGKVPLKDITLERLELVRDKLGTTGITPQRVNRYMAWLRKVLNFAIKKKKLVTNPMNGLTMFPEPQRKVTYLTPQAETKLLEGLEYPTSHWVRLAILTGLRRAEQFSLEWTNVDMEQGIITLPETKAGEVQYVFLNNEAKAILRGFDSWQTSKWVFPSKNPTTHFDAGNFYHRIFLKAVKRGELEGITWHTLRHTYASRLAMAGESETTIAELLRHSGTRPVRRYAHLSQPHLRQAVEKVSAFGKSDGEQTAENVEEVNSEILSNRDGTVMGRARKKKSHV